MVCGLLLLLLSLISSSVCAGVSSLHPEPSRPSNPSLSSGRWSISSAGAFDVYVAQTSYEAVENDNVTLEWTFSGSANGSLGSLRISCQLTAEEQVTALYQLHDGVEAPLPEGGHFAGRVRCDRDALRQGRISLQLSALTPADSGVYRCKVGGTSGECRLNVTGEPPTTTTPHPPNKLQTLSGRGKSILNSFCLFSQIHLHLLS